MENNNNTTPKSKVVCLKPLCVCVSLVPSISSLPVRSFKFSYFEVFLVSHVPSPHIETNGRQIHWKSLNSSSRNHSDGLRATHHILFPPQIKVTISDHNILVMAPVRKEEISCLYGVLGGYQIEEHKGKGMSSSLLGIDKRYSFLLPKSRFQW